MGCPVVEGISCRAGLTERAGADPGPILRVGYVGSSPPAHVAGPRGFQLAGRDAGGMAEAGVTGTGAR
jgi:hypothetical protein